MKSDKSKFLLAHVDSEGDVSLYVTLCPGCGLDHVWRIKKVEGKPCWKFDGNLERPTFSPSMLCRWSVTKDKVYKHVCHSFLKEGIWEFLGDCTHSKKGLKVPMIPYDSP